MALKQLGSTYAVGGDSTAVAADDDNTQYRGNKDFLIWHDEDTTGATNLVEVTYPAPVSGRSIRLEIFDCANLLEDPGDPVPDVGPVCISSSTPVLFPQSALNRGLYRVRITPNSNDPYYKVSVKSPWYALECWEPSKNFYVWGKSGGSPFTQYFFVPTMESGDKIRVRMQTEKGYDGGRLQVYNQAGTIVADFKVLPEEFPKGTLTDHPFFLSEEITAVPTGSGPGEIWKFVLSRYEGLTVSQQPSGNVWVRFSRNVPPYFATDPKRLIRPIVHREFKPFTYTNPNPSYPKKQAYRAYLTVTRGESGIPRGAELRINANTYSASTDEEYSVAVGVVIPFQPTKAEGSKALAQLVDNTGELVADSTDKVNAAYFVKKPSYTGWPSLVVMAYDHGNGFNRTDDLEDAGFNVVQTNKQTEDADSIGNLADHNMKAAGVLYTHHDPDDPPSPPTTKTWYCASKSNAMNSKVLFWMIWDEPDAPAGDGAMPLKTLYELYWKYNSYAAKPYSLNISNPIYIEEFCEACDVIITDPFVYQKNGSRGKYNQNRISDTATEMKYVAGISDAGKKTIIIMHWWYPDNPGDVKAGDDVVYGLSWDKGIAAGVSGLGGWNFSQFIDAETTNILSTYGPADGPVRAVWNKVKAKIAGRE